MEGAVSELVGGPVLLIMKTGMKKPGVLVSLDSTFAVLDYNGERQLIPLTSIDVIKKG